MKDKNKKGYKLPFKVYYKPSEGRHLSGIKSLLIILTSSLIFTFIIWFGFIITNQKTPDAITIIALFCFIIIWLLLLVIYYNNNRLFIYISNDVFKVKAYPLPPDEYTIPIPSIEIYSLNQFLHIDYSLKNNLLRFRQGKGYRITVLEEIDSSTKDVLFRIFNDTKNIIFNRSEDF